MDKQDKENSFLRDMNVKGEITDFRKLKSLEQIDKIGDFHEEFSKFQYYVEPP